MGFGIGINAQGTNAGSLGRRFDIACLCLFTSEGDTVPIFIKFVDMNGEIQSAKVA